MSKSHQFVSHLVGPDTVYDDFESMDGWMDGFTLAYVVITYTGGAGDLVFVEREDVGQGGVVEVDGHGRLGRGVWVGFEGQEGEAYGVGGVEEVLGAGGD